MIVSRERLLSLEEEDVRWRLLLAWVTHQLVGAVIASHSAHEKALYHRLTNPRPGDYVFEVTSYWRGIRGVEPQRYTGFLQKVVAEPYEDHDDSPPPTRDVWYIQYGPADEDVVRWENCAFHVIPVDPKGFTDEIDSMSKTILEAMGHG